MRVRGKIGSIEVVVDDEMSVGKIVVADVDDEEPGSASEVEIELGSWVAETTVELEIEVSPRLWWIWKKRRSTEVEMDHPEEGRPIRWT
jgi:hypothetical protein